MKKHLLWARILSVIMVLSFLAACGPKAAEDETYEIAVVVKITGIPGLMLLKWGSTGQLAS